MTSTVRETRDVHADLKRLVLELDVDTQGFILIIDTPNTMCTHIGSNQSNRLQLGTEATLVASRLLRRAMEDRGQGYKDADD